MQSDGHLSATIHYAIYQTSRRRLSNLKPSQQQALRQVLLTPTDGIAQDITAVDLNQENRSGVPETHMCTGEEIEFAISRMENSSAGED